MLGGKAMLALMLLALDATAQPPAQVSCPPPWTTPWVPNEVVAKQIYLSVGKARFPRMAKKFPVVTVRDGGDHWVVSQGSGKPAVVEVKPGEVVVTSGGGQLSMNIDKCTGTILGAVFNR
jgi:hypothetical protein